MCGRTRLQQTNHHDNKHAYLAIQVPPQQHLPQGFLILRSRTTLPDKILTSNHSITVIAWYWPISFAPKTEQGAYEVMLDWVKRFCKETVFWPPGLLWVEQLSAHSSFTGYRNFRSSLLLLTWSLSCSGFCSSSEPKSPRLQCSARPPVRSTRASDTCPAQSCSYDPWSLEKMESTESGISKVH